MECANAFIRTSRAFEEKYDWRGDLARLPGLGFADDAPHAAQGFQGFEDGRQPGAPSAARGEVRFDVGRPADEPGKVGTAISLQHQRIEHLNAHTDKDVRVHAKAQQVRAFTSAAMWRAKGLALAQAIAQRFSLLVKNKRTTIQWPTSNSFCRQ